MAIQLCFYPSHSLTVLIEPLTDAEFDPQLWKEDPDMDMTARELRDVELLLDLLGNLDSCA